MVGFHPRAPLAAAEFVRERCIFRVTSQVIQFEISQSLRLQLARHREYRRDTNAIRDKSERFRTLVEWKLVSRQEYVNQTTDGHAVDQTHGTAATAAIVLGRDDVAMILP